VQWEECTGLSNTYTAFPQLRHTKTGRENEARAKGADVEWMRKGRQCGWNEALELNIVKCLKHH